MNHKEHNFLSIGSFADATKLSLKALRLYDQLDILKPAYIDPESSYRYYAPDQVRVARLIRMMRQMDMPLATIRLVLLASPQEAEALVREHWRMLQVRVEEARNTVQDLLIALRGEEQKMAYDVQVKMVEALPILSITKRVKVDQLDATIREGIAVLADAAGDNKAGAPFGIYHGSIDHESDGPIEICMPVKKAVQAAESISASELPPTKVAYVKLHGDECAFPKVLKGYDAVVDWMHKNGFLSAGSPREIWYSLNENNTVDHMDIEWPMAE